MFELVVLALLTGVGQQDPGTADPGPRETTEKVVAHRETVVVTAARREQALGDAVSLVSVVDAEDLNGSPALVLDDHLRRIPGFSLFRRSNSLSSHPTTRGVSLRGIGPSGTSRSLVLFDGIPLNDPFGGWVYWNRIPTLALQQVEVARGAASQLYGSSALGGVLQLRPLEPGPGRLAVMAEIGNRETYDVSALASERKGDWGYLVSGRAFETGGFFIVSEEERGAVDTPARVEFQNLLGRVEYKRAHAGVNLFREERNNGTRIQENNSWLALVEGGLEGQSWRLRLYSQFQELNSTFSRVLPDRSQEFKTADQHFPSSGFGSSFTWQPSGEILVGADWRQAHWQEEVQNLSGVFAQYLESVHPRLDVLVGARFDVWENQSTQTSFNPRAGLLFRADPSVTVRGSLYRGFRAPTLNELYRPFRTGNILTEANPGLAEEHLWGFEGGMDIHPGPALLIRVNGFWNTLQDPVSNVTVAVSPELILRQRRNLGSGTIKGVETEVVRSLASRWALRASYLYSQAVVDETGRLFPQVPRHQGLVGVEYQGPIQFRVEGRFLSRQYEDDLNQLPLAGYGVLDLQVRKPLAEHLELFVGVQNLFNREYAVGRLPIERLGTPRLIHGGVRFRIGN